ncbi:MAG TPA: lysophospholipid acyltransferase family protein [Gemmatimonadales bacterium]|nr:lysophospholipid acyltransferase family protein [Gemmatimonadales bacterium]
MKLRWAEPIAAAVGPTLAHALAATWRYRVTGDEHIRALRAERRPFVFVLWHNSILPLLYLHRREDVVMLISRHRDGGYLADLGERWGYRSVRGSTQRGGEVGLLGVVRALEAGAVVAITPDGPRGPAERVQPGAVAAAQHAGVPLIPVGARPRAAWRLKSWDRMRIPKPFTMIDVAYGQPIHVDPGKDGLRRGMDAVASALRAVTDAA